MLHFLPLLHTPSPYPLHFPMLYLVFSLPFLITTSRLSLGTSTAVNPPPPIPRNNKCDALRYIFSFLLHVVRTGVTKMQTRFWWTNMRKKSHLKDLGVDGKIIFNWILNKSDERAWTWWMWLRIGTSGGLL
jgi:hypothetical protein